MDRSRCAFIYIFFSLTILWMFGNMQGCSFKRQSNPNFIHKTFHVSCRLYQSSTLRRSLWLTSLAAGSWPAALSHSVSHSYLLASCFIQAASSASQAEQTLRQAGSFISTKLLQLDNLFQLSFSVPSPSVAPSLSCPLSPPCPPLAPPLYIRGVFLSPILFSVPCPLFFWTFPRSASTCQVFAPDIR